MSAQTMRVHRALASRCAHGQRLAAQYQQTQDAVERDWSQRGLAGTSQMEMSPNSTMESELRALNVLIALVGIAAAAACTMWLALGGLDLIRGLMS